MSTKLFILEPTPMGIKDWPHWDTLIRIIVRAINEENARKLATQRSGYEGIETWLDNSKTSCKELHTQGIEEIIMTDFRDG